MTFVKDSLNVIADADILLKADITLAKLSERLIEEAVMDLNDASILVGVSLNDILVAVIPLCACNDCVTPVSYTHLTLPTIYSV